MNEYGRKDAPDMVGPVMERLGYQRSSGLHRSSGIRLAMLTVVVACVLASCSLIVLSFFSSQQPSVAQSGDVISDAIVRSRQDAARLGKAIFSLQSPIQDPQEMTSKAVKSDVRGENASAEMSNEDIEGSFQLEATFGNDGRYDDMASRGAGQSD